MPGSVPQGGLSLNHELHQTIYSACDQPYLIELIRQQHNRLAPYYRIYLDAGLRNVAWAAHRRIYEACLKKDAALAEEEIRKHCEEVCEGILAAIGSTTNTSSAAGTIRERK